MVSEKNNKLTHTNYSHGSEHLSSPRPSWHKPTITRIELKRTMLGEGSNTDGEVPSQGIDFMNFDK